MGLRLGLGLLVLGSDGLGDPAEQEVLPELEVAPEVGVAAEPGIAPEIGVAPVPEHSRAREKPLPLENLHPLEHSKEPRVVTVLHTAIDHLPALEWQDQRMPSLGCQVACTAVGTKDSSVPKCLQPVTGCDGRLDSTLPHIVRPLGMLEEWRTRLEWALFSL